MTQQLPGDPGFVFKSADYNENGDWFGANQQSLAARLWSGCSTYNYLQPEFSVTSDFPRKSAFLDHSYDPIEKFRTKPQEPLGGLEQLYKNTHRLMSTGRHSGKTFTWSRFLEDPYEMRQILPGELFVSKDIRELVKEKQTRENAVDEFIGRDIRSWLNEIPLVTYRDTDLDATRKMFKNASFSRNENGNRMSPWRMMKSRLTETVQQDGTIVLEAHFPTGSSIMYYFSEKGELQEVVNTQPQTPPKPTISHNEHCMLEPVYSHAFGGAMFESLRRKVWAKEITEKS